MSAKPDGGSAFPISAEYDETAKRYVEHSRGMSIRDFFAAQALQGLLADSRLDLPLDHLCRLSFEAADGMLAERGKP